MARELDAPDDELGLSREQCPSAAQPDHRERGIEFKRLVVREQTHPAVRVGGDFSDLRKPMPSAIGEKIDDRLVHASTHKPAASRRGDAPAEQAL